MTMLEKTDNDLPKANDENVSDKASIPNTKKEDETAETPSETSVEAVTGKQAKKDEPTPEKQQEEAVAEPTEAVAESTEAVTDADKTKEADEASDEDVAAKTESKEQKFDGMDPKEMLAYFSEALSSKPIQSLKRTVDALTKAFEKEN